MTVTLQFDDQSIDITEFLDDDSETEIGQELERKAFQRTVEDVSLKVSNLGGEFADWLTSPTSVYRIKIEDEERVLFYGIIERPIHFDVAEEWVSFDCYSLTRNFWDRAKQTRISKATPIGQEDQLYVNLEELIKREVTMERFGDLINGFQISDLYAARQVRFWGFTADKSIRNNGRYRNLDPRTTIDDLLKAMSMYYNADIFIDPNSQLLVMEKRNEVLTDSNHQLDEILIEDEEMTAEIYDEQRIDYLGLSLNLGHPQAPIPKRTENAVIGKGAESGVYKWAITFVYCNGSLEIESELGDEAQQWLSDRVAHDWKVYLELPLGPGGCVARKIYRTRNCGMGTFYLVGRVDNNSDTNFMDAISNLALSVSARENAQAGRIWIRYDEETGIWDDPVQDDAAGLLAPMGVTFDVMPQLRFLARQAYEQEIEAIYPYEGKVRIRTKEENGFEKGMGITINHSDSTPPVDGHFVVDEVFDDKHTFSTGASVTGAGTTGAIVRWSDADKETTLEVLPENGFDVFSFFGNEKDRLADLMEQWKDLFRTRTRAKVTVEGLAFRIGDSCSLSVLLNGLTIGNCVIKRATNNLTKERTNLELLTI